ncbi:protocadherin-18a precursor [Danio rerio]|uniref:Protocadherin 18 n=1 Tax=Danio rerio TaxID=7955 RepID=A9QUV5_DANRE|nr:protocadherin-18a precursor [Danio rerio]ABX64360.1 protocadherin 18 [Danio rerio]|eukprot:NP_001108530.1 protocadherin-18 precursor [Danio rerio]
METSKGTVLCATLLKLALLVTLAGYTTAATLKYQVYEEQKVGTVIARLREDVADVLSKLPSSIPLRFRAMQRGSASLLSVRDQDGEISIRTKIDREKLCEKNLNCTIEFDVLTLPTEHLQLFHIEVEILDINDNAPQFARPVIPIEISETAAVGTRIPLDSATDPDVGENSLNTYSLTPSGFFKIDILTRTDGAKYAELVVLKELDREVRASYELQLTASDRGVPPKFGTTLLKISIADSNDNNPVFEKPSYVINLLENSPLGSLLIDLNATDPDEGTNGKIIYSFSSHVSPKILETFKINSDNGHLTLMRKVDFESTNSYDIDVQAQDMGPNSMPAHCKVIIKVVDVNDNKPDISVNLMSTGNEEIAYISETAPVDTFVALVSVNDLDSGLNGEVECRLYGQGHFRLQKSYEKNYMILTNVTLDREKRSEFSLTVIAEDKGSPSLSTIKNFIVEVQDENDNAPSFAKSRYEISKAENNSPGAYLSSVKASDPDLGPNGQVSYSILESMVHGSSISTYVTIDPSNGDIYALRTFDREDVSQISFLVQARDSGNPPLRSNVTVVLTVLDENDNRPVIMMPQLWNHTADVPVSKYAEIGDVVTVVRAMDHDAGANGDLSCSVVGGNEAGYFNMDPKTCEIRTNVSIQEVPQDHVELTILVQDHGTPTLSARALLRLSLYENIENLMNPHLTGGRNGDGPLDVSMIIIISLGAICAVLLLIMVAFALRCSREKKDTRSYNCRVAESTYQQHPKKPSRQIHKGDITLMPTVNGTLPIRAHHRSPTSSPGAERAHMGSRQSQHSRQSLNSLVTISSNHIPENFALELTHATPPVEGQYQPRPSFRGNKYSRSYRYALQDMDKFSLKDSGRGDSDAGDSDCEMGRDSPIDRLLGDGFGDLFHSDGHHRLHPVMRLCTEECRVLGHSDQCWMPSQASSDYRANMFIPGEESRPQVLEEDQQSVDSAKKSFSTFGKDNEEECGGSLLSEMNNVLQRLLPTSYADVRELDECTSQPASSIGMEIGKGFLPGKASSTGSAYPQGVAVWAANTHFQNPGGAVTSGHAATNHAASQAHLKWLPAMEEIPENYEEDDLESVLSQRQGKRNDTRHEVVDASELVAEINKLLQDVRQS